MVAAYTGSAGRRRLAGAEGLHRGVARRGAAVRPVPRLLAWPSPAGGWIFFVVRRLSPRARSARVAMLDASREVPTSAGNGSAEATGAPAGPEGLHGRANLLLHDGRRRPRGRASCPRRAGRPCRCPRRGAGSLGRRRRPRPRPSWWSRAPPRRRRRPPARPPARLARHLPAADREGEDGEPVVSERTDMLLVSAEEAGAGWRSPAITGENPSRRSTAPPLGVVLRRGSSLAGLTATRPVPGRAGTRSAWRCSPGSGTAARRGTPAKHRALLTIAVAAAAMAFGPASAFAGVLGFSPQNGEYTYTTNDAGQGVDELGERQAGLDQRLYDLHGDHYDSWKVGLAFTDGNIQVLRLHVEHVLRVPGHEGRDPHGHGRRHHRGRPDLEGADGGGGRRRQ